MTMYVKTKMYGFTCHSDRQLRRFLAKIRCNGDLMPLDKSLATQDETDIDVSLAKEAVVS